MKKIIYLILLMSFYTLSSEAQSKKHDIGLNYGGPRLFGIRYRGGNDKTLLRITLSNLGGLYQHQKEPMANNKSTSNGLGLSVGIERRRLIRNNLYFYYGPEFINSIDGNTDKNIMYNRENRDLDFRTGLGCNLGFVYLINEDINISVEAVPSVWYSVHKSATIENGTKTTHKSAYFGYGFNERYEYSNSFASVTLSFSLGKH
jgi:hypothetical protein